MVTSIRWFVLGGVLASALATGPAFAETPSVRTRGGRIAVGSKGFTENRLLGEMMAQIIEAKTTLSVERRLSLGGTMVVFAAMQSGDIDLCPEYTGTAWSVHLGRTDPVSNPLEVFLEVQGAFERRFDMVWLPPFGFNNGYALVMDETRAEALGITTLSDLKAHERDLRVALTHEFLNREDGFLGLARKYGFRFPQLRGIEHGLAYQAVRSGQTDVVDAYTTDGKLLRYGLRVLRDDKRFFPPYDAAPLVRRDTLERYPELRGALRALAFAIDDATMRELNAQVEDRDGAFAAVATEFLRERGYLATERRPGRDRAPDGEPAADTAEDVSARGEATFVDFMWARRGQTLQRAYEHLWLTGLAVLLATLFAVPLGVWLTRNPGFSPSVLGAAGVIQTVPSLALLAFMIPLPGFGLGARSAVAALFLYAILPILRNTYTGIREVDPELVEAAHAMGLRDRQVLRLLELPLATRTIMAGIRTSSVISVGVATLAAFIGAGGLGEPIVTGLTLNNTYMILSGAIPAALLAVLVDFALGLAERWLVPRGLG